MINSLPTGRVNEVFCTLSGESDATPYSVLCSSAAGWLLCRVKPSATNEKWQDALCYAAGCLAYYRYCLSAGGDNVTSYKAGDMTINSDVSHAATAARALLDDALAALSGCIKDGFCFRSF